MESEPAPRPGQDPNWPPSGDDPAYQPTISGPAPGYPPPQAPPSQAMPPGEGFIVAQPYPYPGAQPPPAPWPPAPATAPATRTPRRRGRIIGITALVVVMFAAGATAAVLLLKKTESPTTMALQSGQALGPSAGVTLTGTINGASANVTVTRAGTVEGSYTEDNSQVSRVTINGVTYLKAPVAFWSAEGDGTGAPQADGRWAKAPADRVFVSFASFTPGQISRVLEHVGQHPRVADTTFGGSKVIKLTDNGTTYYITTSVPNRLIHMDGTSGAARYSFDVTPLTAATISPVFTILHGDVQAMRGAAEPDATVLPEQKIQFHSNCNGNTSCTVSIKVTVTAHSPSVLLTMTVGFSGTKGGHPFATCTDTVTANTTATATVTPSCGLGSPAWSRWVNSHTSDFNTWADPTFTVTVNTASDVAAMQSELNREQAT